MRGRGEEGKLRESPPGRAYPAQREVGVGRSETEGLRD